MFERFTDRARKVLMLANQKAIQFNHEWVGTEHILLGLIKEGSGVAAAVLKNFDLDLYRLQSEVLKLVEVGPQQVIMGKLPLTSRSKKVIEHAIEEAKALQHNYVGTEHVLLGLLRCEEGSAYEVLKNLGVEAQTVREEIMLLVAPTEKQDNIVTNPVLGTLCEHRLFLLRSESQSEAELSNEDNKPPRQEWCQIQLGSTIVLPPGYRIISASHVSSQEGNLLTSTYEMQKMTKSPKDIDYGEQFLIDLGIDLADETRRCLDIIKKKVDYCKENHQEMIACVLLQVMREIEGKQG